jgi:hypothetical protein
VPEDGKLFILFAEEKTKVQNHKNAGPSPGHFEKNSGKKLKPEKIHANERSLTAVILIEEELKFFRK